MTGYLTLFYVFFKLGLFGFGGGYAILPMIYQDIQVFGMMSAREFSDVVAISQMTPGPIAINAATYVGFKYLGVGGAVIATAAVCLPSLIIISLIVYFLDKFKSSRLIENVLTGIRPAVAGLIASTTVFFLGNSVYNAEVIGAAVASGREAVAALFSDPLSVISIPSIIIFVLAIVVSKKTKAGPILITVASGVLGALICF